MKKDSVQPKARPGPRCAEIIANVGKQVVLNFFFSLQSRLRSFPTKFEWEIFSLVVPN
jgi:hypothetical protein